MLVSNLMDFDLTVTNVEFALEKTSPLNWELHCHSKAYHGLVYVIDGYAKYIYKDRTVQAGPDTILYLAKNSTYHTVSYSDIPYHYIIITFHLDREIELPMDIISSPIHKKRLLELFRQIVKANFTKAHGYIFYSRSLVQQLIYHIIQENLHSNSSTTYMQAVIDYVEDYYGSKISIDTLSKIARLSTSHFRKKFKEIYGIAPLDYVNCLRVEKAKDLLRSELYTQSEIATLCGFENVCYFNKVFKKYTGTTPGKY